VGLRANAFRAEGSRCSVGGGWGVVNGPFLMWGMGPVDNQEWEVPAEGILVRASNPSEERKKKKKQIRNKEKENARPVALQDFQGR